MTTKDFFIKWLAYTLALLPLWFLQELLLSRYPLMGVKPMLLPLCTVAVATLEGALGGAGFGLGVGLLFDASSAGALEAMLSVAGREILWSLCFVPLVYLIFRWVFHRVPKATVL